MALSPQTNTKVVPYTYVYINKKNWGLDSFAAIKFRLVTRSDEAVYES